MSLITCPKCGSQTSDAIDLCSHCWCNHVLWKKRELKKSSRGYREKTTFLDWVKIIAVFILLFFIVSAFGGNVFLLISSAAVTFFNMLKEIVLIITNL